MEQTVQVGLLGLGTVGSGVFELLKKNHKLIAERTGFNFQIKKIAVLDVHKIRTGDVSPELLTDQPETILDDDKIDIVVELIGGDIAAKTYVMHALKRKKPVVTANKALLAKHGREIFHLAKASQTWLAFEASVAGGIPIIKALREGLVANSFQKVFGILNGTTNYILTRMHQAKISYQAALKEAQDLGYAEKDPHLDVSGGDAAHKLTLLASLAFGIPLSFEKIAIEGIEDLEADDIRMAEELGYVIKSLVIAEKQLSGISLRVHPTLVSEDHLLAHVNGGMNAVYLQGDAAGSNIFYGPGAGSLPTASAVVADLVDLAYLLSEQQSNPSYPGRFGLDDGKKNIQILPLEMVESRYSLRLLVADRAGVLAHITRVLGQNGVSIQALTQKETEENDGSIPVVILTHRCKESDLNKVIEELQSTHDIVFGPVRKIRIER